jgi:CBS domain-containing protein
MRVIIGMYPHKRSATIEVVDDRGRVLAASMVGVQDAPGSRPPAPPVGAFPHAGVRVPERHRVIIVGGAAMAQKVREIMTAQPVTLSPNASLVDAARLMRDHDIGDVLVVGGDSRLQGIVTDRDLVVRASAQGLVESRSTTLGQVCSTDPAVVTPDDDADHAVELMRDRAVRRIPVVDAGALVGVATLGDLAVKLDPRSALADISAAPQSN